MYRICEVKFSNPLSRLETHYLHNTTYSLELTIYVFATFPASVSHL